MCKGVQAPPDGCCHSQFAYVDGLIEAAARELVAKWRAMHRQDTWVMWLQSVFWSDCHSGLAQETDAVDDVSADLEKALWEDLVTEDDVDDRSLAERVDHIRGKLVQRSVL